MKRLIILVTILTVVAVKSKAQNNAPSVPAILDLIRSDDSAKLKALVTKENINACYGDYSLLSHAVRFNAYACFIYLITNKANVNQVCNDYIPPLMHAVKYGRLEFVKILVAKGANVNYSYDGDRVAQGVSLHGMTPITYAERFEQTNVVEYLRTMKH